MASKVQYTGKVKSDSSATIEISDAPSHEIPHLGAFAVSGIDVEPGDEILDEDKTGAKSHNRTKYTHEHTHKTHSSIESSQHHKEHQNIAQRDEAVAMKEVVLFNEREEGANPPGHVLSSNAKELQACREDRHPEQGASGGQHVVSSARNQGTNPGAAVLDSQGRHPPVSIEETRPGAVVVPGIDDDGGNEEQATVVTSEESTVHIFARVVDTEEENRRLCEQDRILHERNQLLQERNRLLQMMPNAVVISPVVITYRDVENGNEQVAGQKVERKKAGNPLGQKVERKKAGDPLDLLNQSHNALHAWKDIYKVEKENADAAYSYAKQLWCEDAAKRAHGKGKVYGGEWTVKQFDREMKRLKNEEEPVWDTLIKKVDGIRENLEGPHRDVKATHEHVKKSLRTHPFMMLLASKGDMFSRTINLRHEYQDKLQQQYKDAETEFQLLCGSPDGTLARVKLLRENYLTENTRMIEYVHNQKFVRSYKMNQTSTLGLHEHVFLSS